MSLQSLLEYVRRRPVSGVQTLTFAEIDNRSLNTATYAYSTRATQESTVVKAIHRRPPYRGVGVQDRCDSHDSRVFLQKVFVIQHGVLHHYSGGDANVLVAQVLLPRREESRTRGLDLGDINGADVIAIHPDELFYLLAAVFENNGVGEDVIYHPESARHGVDQGRSHLANLSRCYIPAS